MYASKAKTKTTANRNLFEAVLRSTLEGLIVDPELLLRSIIVIHLLPSAHHALKLNDIFVVYIKGRAIVIH